MSFEIWLLFVVVAIVPAVSPGPAILLAISNTLRFGRRATLWSAAGNALGLVVMGFMVAYGFGAVMAVSATAFTVLKLIGAAYLVYLGVKVWRDPAGLNAMPASIVPRDRSWRLCRQAFLVAVTNPKAMLVLAALLPQFLTADAPVLPQVLVLSVTYALMCYANHLVLAFFAAPLRRALQSRRTADLVRRLTGGLFIGFGAALAASSR